MKTLFQMIVLLFAVLSSSITMANGDITGTWEGNLAIGPDTKLTIQFIISQNPDGSYAAVLNTPDESNVKNVPANEVVYSAGNLKVSVADLSGSYDGVLKDGEIEGQWEQMGTSFPLILKPYAKPSLSKEDMDMLLGAWQGKPVLPEGVMIASADDLPTYVFLFKMSDQGEFTGTFTMAGMGIPDQPLVDMGISDGIFTFKIGEMRKFKGEITDNEIVGVLKMVADTNFPGESLTLVKGEYEAPVYSLNLPKEIKDQLSGEWNGTLTMKTIQTISMAVVFRFETSKNGDFLGFVKTPEQGDAEIAITDANMSDGNLVLAVKAMGGEFTGKISGDKISGDWKQEMAGSSTPLTLNRGPYVAPVYTLNLPEETMGQLSGKWNGKLHNMDIAIRFENSEKGDFQGFFDRPQTNQMGVPLTDASLSEGKLTLKIKTPLPSEFVGELSDDKLVGDWKQMNNSFSLTFDKEMP